MIVLDSPKKENQLEANKKEEVKRGSGQSSKSGVSSKSAKRQKIFKARSSKDLNQGKFVDENHIDPNQRKSHPDERCSKVKSEKQMHLSVPNQKISLKKIDALKDKVKSRLSSAAKKP